MYELCIVEAIKCSIWVARLPKYRVELTLGRDTHFLFITVTVWNEFMR